MLKKMEKGEDESQTIKGIYLMPKMPKKCPNCPNIF
jgi:hypothetical protein